MAIKWNNYFISDRVLHLLERGGHLTTGSCKYDPQSIFSHISYCKDTRMLARVLPVSSLIVSVTYNNHPTQDALENMRTQYVYCCGPDFINTLPRHFVFSGSLSTINSDVCVVTGKNWPPLLGVGIGTYVSTQLGVLSRRGSLYRNSRVGCCCLADQSAGWSAAGSRLGLVHLSDTSFPSPLPWKHSHASDDFRLTHVLLHWNDFCVMLRRSRYSDITQPVTVSSK